MEATLYRPLSMGIGRETHCIDCALKLICLPSFVKAKELSQLDAIMLRGRPIQRGNLLFHQGQLFDQVFAIRSGYIKTTETLSNGEEQITGFFSPGEIVGLDSIGNSTYANTAFALETTTVCAIEHSQLKFLSQKIPSLQDHLLNLMSGEIRKNQRILRAISQHTAEKRVAMLLLALSARYKICHLSEDKFRLPMSRCDIGNYLGLALETVSRAFTHFQQLGVLEVNNKEIIVLNRAYLSDLIEPNTVLN
jgi:CRP/FNR family transcriptional regulator